jgi:4-hydroxy-tetrahydrodipicolinate synthase
MLDAVAGRVQVIVGVSAPGFAQMADLSSYVMAEGAAAVMVAPPGTLKGDAAVRRYFFDVVDAIGDEVPFVVQDFPLATGVAMSPDLIQEIAESYQSCVMLKHEDWPGLDKISRLREMHGNGRRRISILTGNGGIFLPDEIARGADGAMTGFAYPELLVQICDLMASGQRTVAHDLFDAYLPLIRYEQQPGIGLPARKYVLEKRGAIASRFARRPVPTLTAASMSEIDWMMARLEKRLAQMKDK